VKILQIILRKMRQLSPVFPKITVGQGPLLPDWEQPAEPYVKLCNKKENHLGNFLLQGGFLTFLVPRFRF
jgi:hypothetical protein